ALLDGHTTVERVRELSSYQADYWACAIPDSLPPSPNRRSPHWNPNKEYEDLLDYAYPLKPRYKLGKMPEAFLHDSGIGLDSFSVSPESTLRSTSVYSRGGQAQGGRENGCWRFMGSAERFSTSRAGKRGCSGIGLYYEPLPIANAPFTMSASSHPSGGIAKDVTMEAAEPGLSDCSAADGRSWSTGESLFPHYQGQVKSTSRFLPTTRVLPLRKEWEGGEEFLSLPPKLRELERLAQFLSSLSLTIRTPGHNHQTLPRRSDSRQHLSSVLAPFRDAGGRDERGNIEDYAGLWPPCSSPKPSWENTELCGGIHRDPLQRLNLPTGLRDASDGTYLHEPQAKGHPKKSRQGESLAHSSWVASHPLQVLYQSLDGMKITLLISNTQFPSKVCPGRQNSLILLLQTLNCHITTTSILRFCFPALKDTLGLIAEQSEVLETHAEHLYESVLAAAGPLRGKDGMEDNGVQQTAAQWVSR
ncbi:CEP68 protein, partial [Ceuthmochares aereus]|nr:CEP68 protein [Ceuthmochares aereus]